jgi:hypothetical protein
MTTNSAASALSGTPAAPADTSATVAPNLAATPPTAVAPTAPASTEWFAGIQNNDVKTWVEAKGFKDPLAVAESAYNLEKLIGFDKAGKTVVVPDENSSPETRKAFLTKMGVPEKADGYKLPVPTGGNDAFAKEAANWFHEQGVPAKAAEGLTTKFNEYAAAQQTAAETAFAASAERDFTELKTEWGQAFNQNIELGKRAAMQFIPGTDAERGVILDKLERSLGTGALLKLMSSIGQGLGEHKMYGAEGNGGAMTPAQATQRIAELKSNKEWTAAYLSGDKSKTKELQDLISASNPQV